MSPIHKGRNLFPVKRLVSLMLMALVLSTALALATGVASAKTTSPARATASSKCWGPCDGLNPVTTGCWDGTAVSQYPNTGWVGGRGVHIVVYYSFSCQAAWAYVTLDWAPAPGDYADAIVTRTSDNRQFDCTTGNGIVNWRRTSCYSGMVDDLYTTAWGAGMYSFCCRGGWGEIVRTTGAY